MVIIKSVWNVNWLTYFILCNIDKCIGCTCPQPPLLQTASTCLSLDVNLLSGPQRHPHSQTLQLNPYSRAWRGTSLLFDHTWTRHVLEERAWSPVLLVPFRDALLRFSHVFREWCEQISMHTLAALWEETPRLWNGSEDDQRLVQSNRKARPMAQSGAGTQREICK